MKSKKIISIILSVLTLISVTPISVFAQSSIGSTSSNVSIGEDIEQKAKTKYENIEEGTAQTEVYLTIEDSDLIVSVPTTIILSGTPDEKGEYIGEYSVSVKGDMSGSKVATVKPENDVVLLKQKGKNNIEAEISQEQTEFNSDDFTNKKKTLGKVTAEKLTAGSWIGNTTFIIGIESKMDYKEIATMAFENSPTLNRGADYFESMSKHTKSNVSVNSKTYFAIPVTPQKQINIINNSDTQTLSVYMLHKTDLSVVAKVTPRLDYTIPLTTPYLALSVTNNDGSDIKPEEVELENFIISYTDNNENILDEMKNIAYDYSHTGLKNFDADAIRTLNDNSPWCAHASGTKVPKDKNTERAIISAIDRGAYVIEIDIRKTSDNVLVCEHNEILTGTTKKVSENTYTDCLLAKSDLLTFEQALNIVKEHSDTVLLSADVKTTDCYNLLYEVIDKYDFSGRLDHSLITAEHYGADIEARSKRATLCLNNHSESGFYSHYANFAKECIAGTKTGVSMWDGVPAYNSSNYSVRTAFALYFVTAYAGDEAFYRRNLYDNVHIPLPADDKTMEQNIIDLMPHRFWTTNDCLIN